MERLRFPEMLVRNYHYSLRNDPEECSSQDKIVLNPTHLLYKVLEK